MADPITEAREAYEALTQTPPKYLPWGTLKTISAFIESYAALEAERDELKAAKWDVKHVDTMNDVVALGLDRDHWKRQASDTVASNNRLLERARDADRELAETERLLKDPAAVHINMMRGGIGMLSEDQVFHLYPKIRDERDALRAQVEALTKELNEAKGYLAMAHPAIKTLKTARLKNEADIEALGAQVEAMRLALKDCRRFITGEPFPVFDLCCRIDALSAAPVQGDLSSQVSQAADAAQVPCAAQPMYVQAAQIPDDELYPSAVQLLHGKETISVSAIQRALQIGYNRACRFIEKMEAEGLVRRVDEYGNTGKYQISAAPEHGGEHG